MCQARGIFFTGRGIQDIQLTDNPCAAHRDEVTGTGTGTDSVKSALWFFCLLTHVRILLPVIHCLRQVFDKHLTDHIVLTHTL